VSKTRAFGKRQSGAQKSQQEVSSYTLVMAITRADADRSASMLSALAAFHNGLIFELIVTLRNLIEHDVRSGTATHDCHFLNHLLLALTLGTCARPISTKNCCSLRQSSEDEARGCDVKNLWTAIRKKMGIDLRVHDLHMC
jgi:hypothetical protein